MWDFSIQTDHVIRARRPNLVVVDKKERSCKIIDIAVPGDSRIEEREKDKIEKYQDLGRELQKIWNVKVKVIPLVIGSLGAIPKQFGNRLKPIGTTEGTGQVQKTVLLGTARILRKVLEIEGCWLISSIVLLCVSSIIIIVIIIIIIKFLEILGRCPLGFSHVLRAGEVLFSLDRQSPKEGALK